MNIDEFIEYLDCKSSIRVSWGYESIDTSFETMPYEFIKYAEIDLESNVEHKYINALSNAKRALDCQADRLMKLFGFYEKSQKKRWGFPNKVEMINRFEIIAPRVLSKINKTRNLMEHQYIKPQPEQVEDFIDIVILFLASTDNYINNFIKEVEYLNETEIKYENIPEIRFTFNNITSEILITTSKYSDNPIKLELNKENPKYIDILKRHINKIRTY
jgi:hypothetical protein